MEVRGLVFLIAKWCGRVFLIAKWCVQRIVLPTPTLKNLFWTPVRDLASVEFIYCPALKIMSEFLHSFCDIVLTLLGGHTSDIQLSNRPLPLYRSLARRGKLSFVSKFPLGFLKAGSQIWAWGEEYSLFASSQRLLLGQEEKCTILNEYLRRRLVT